MLPEQHNHEREKRLTNAVKTDRTQWLNNMLDKEHWKEIRKLRKSFCPKQGRPKKGQDVVESNPRADVLAKHFETVQWCSRFTTGAGGDRLEPPLPMWQDDITVEEMIFAATTLKNRKATGKDNMPAEFWKTCCQWGVCLCDKVRCNGHVPDGHTSEPRPQHFSISQGCPLYPYPPDWGGRGTYVRYILASYLP